MPQYHKLKGKGEVEGKIEVTVEGYIIVMTCQKTDIKPLMIDTFMCSYTQNL